MPEYIVSEITCLRVFFVKKRIGVGIVLAVLVIAGIRVSGSAQFAVMTKKADRAEYMVCIDSGHGGNDPGKIGVAGTKEKEVNLAIALKLKKQLEKQNIRVIMTRTDDRNLADANVKNEKTSDMKNRVAKMDSEQPDAVVSIHQNSYTDSSAKGAQVFYYEGSEEQMIAHMFPDGVLTMESALYYYKYLSQRPFAWHIAISKNVSKSRFNMQIRKITEWRRPIPAIIS